MVKNHLEKNGSFGQNEHVNSPKPHSTTSTEVLHADQHFQEESDHSLNTHNEDVNVLSDEIDGFVHVLSACFDKSNLPEVPDAVEAFSKIIESRINKYNSCESTTTRLGRVTEDDGFFIDSVIKLSNLTNSLCEFPSTRWLNRTSLVLQRAMTFMEEELRTLLEDSRASSNARVGKNSSFDANNQLEGSEQCGLNREEEYSPDVLARMNRIASVMILAGYETECCQVYSISRRSIFSEQMKKLEFEKINMEDVQRMPWDSLEGEITRWIRVVKTFSTSLFPGEKRIGESVFPDSPRISRHLLSNLAHAIVIQLLDFAEAVAMIKRSAEKLFKYLDMYEAIRDLTPVIIDSCPYELISEISATADTIGEAAVNIFCDMENSIKNDIARTPVPGGAVHPLTRYVMNYLKYACEYKDTLEHIFQQQVKIEECIDSPVKLRSSLVDVEKESESPHSSSITVAATTPFSIQLVTVMDLLDTNLEAKSSLYRDPSLRHIFLMNNARYMLQKVKGSTEIHQVMGDTWCRRRSTIVRQHHKNYQRETWGRVLQLLSHVDGLQAHGKVVKAAVKERFKNFNTMFDEIHRTQTTWVLSDEQLQSELRVSISALVIPAYRSFFGRFRQCMDNARQAEKYIKYQPEDIESLIDDLFDGNSASMARRKTYTI